MSETTPLKSPLPSDWHLIPLGEMCSKIGSGATPLGGSEAYVRNGTTFIRSQNVHDHRFSRKGLVFIDEQAATKLSGASVQPRDVLLNITGDGDTIARCCIAPKEVLPARVNQHVVIIRPTRKLVPEFLQRYLSHPLIREYMLSHNSGGSRRALTKSQIEGFEIVVPPLTVQSAIVEVLGALDDKIAVNDRMVSISLRLADTLYEAFSAGADSGPETFGTIAAIYGGGTPSTAEPSYWDGGIAWTTPSDVTALSAPYLFQTSRKITESGLANCASQLYPAGSIFMTSRATIGAFAIPQIPAAVNQGFIVVVPPKDELRWWLFHEMRSRIDDMLGLANGSTFLELSRRNFKSMPVRIGALDVLKRFDAKAAPLHERAARAVQESEALAELRDILLPKLMSGEIRVRDAEKVVDKVT